MGLLSKQGHGINVANDCRCPFIKDRIPGAPMPAPDNDLSRPRRHFIDYFLYALAGAVILSFIYSFLLWLQY